MATLATLWLITTASPTRRLQSPRLVPPRGDQAYVRIASKTGHKFKSLDRRIILRGLPQLVAIDDCALSPRYVVEDAALDKRVYARVAEQDQRSTIIVAARIAHDLPSLREQLVDR